MHIAYCGKFKLSAESGRKWRPLLECMGQSASGRKIGWALQNGKIAKLEKIASQEARRTVKVFWIVRIMTWLRQDFRNPKCNIVLPQMDDWPLFNLTNKKKCITFGKSNYCPKLLFNKTALSLLCYLWKSPQLAIDENGTLVKPQVCADFWPINIYMFNIYINIYIFQMIVHYHCGSCYFVLRSH